MGSCCLVTVKTLLLILLQSHTSCILGTGAHGLCWDSVWGLTPNLTSTEGLSREQGLARTRSISTGRRYGDLSKAGKGTLQSVQGRGEEVEPWARRK